MNYSAREWSSTFKWDNPAPPGTYKAVFALQILFCPPEQTRACNDFLSNRNQPITFTINVNGKPTANDQTVSTKVNTPLDITLTATDPDGDNLAYAILSQPTHGSLKGTDPSVTYAPKQDYTGPDGFAFKVNDGKVDSNTTTVNIMIKSANRPPVAVGSWSSLPPTPPEKAFIGAEIKLDGSQSYDPDEQEGDKVIKWEWKKTSPSDDYVANALTDPNSETARFKLPDYIPMQSNLIGSPTPLPIEFTLVVEDTHQLPSNNNEIVSVNMECPPFSQKEAEDTKNNLFIKLINDPRAPLLPQTVDNFRYFLSGSGDTVGKVEGVSGKGTPKLLPVSWLEKRSKAIQFEDAQLAIAQKVQKDMRALLSTMKVGETKTLPSKVYSEPIDAPSPVGAVHPPTLDFYLSVGHATLQLFPDLKVTKINTGTGSSVSGKVTLMLIDIYDFNIGSFIQLPFFLGGGTFYSTDIHSIIRCLGARNFDQTTSYDKIITNMNIFSFPELLTDCIRQCKIQS